MFHINAADELLATSAASSLVILFYTCVCCVRFRHRALMMKKFKQLLAWSNVSHVQLCVCSCVVSVR